MTSIEAYGEGELVAVALPAGRALLDVLERAWAAGATCAPLDPAAPAAVRTAQLAELRPHRVIDHDGTSRRGDGRTLSGQPALAIATSGSGGRPRFALLSHRALRASVAASLARLASPAGQQWVCCLPTHHIAGLAVLLRARALGSAPLIEPRFDPARFTGLPNGAAVALVPTMLSRLLDAGVDLSRFAVLLTGGGPLPAALAARAAAAGARVVESYGMTETAGGCCYDGRPLDGVEVAVDADDRIRIAGATLFDGYLDDADGRDGRWFVTADRGQFTDDGRLVVLGRHDAVIVSGGENIDAAAVTAALTADPAVADAYVAGVTDPHWGAIVAAWLVPRDRLQHAGPVDAATRERLRGVVAARLGRQAAPRALRWVTALPRGPLGKVRRDALPPMRDDGH